MVKGTSFSLVFDLYDAKMPFHVIWWAFQCLDFHPRDKIILMKQILVGVVLVD